MNVSPYYWGGSPYSSPYNTGWSGQSWPASYYSYPSAGYSQYAPTANPPLQQIPQQRSLSVSHMSHSPTVPVASPVVHPHESPLPLFTQPKSHPAVTREGEHPHEHAGRGAGSRLKHLVVFGGLLLGSLLLHDPRLVANNAFKLVSNDWKDWAKVFLGVGAVGQLNKALDWKPPPWLNAIETVAAISPLTMGFNINSLKQGMIMAPLVAAMVHGASKLNDNLDEPLQQKYNIPSILTKLAISVGMAFIGFKLYPPLLRAVAKTGFLGKAAQDNASKAALGIGTMMCTRGCCTSLICLSEVGEMVGAFLNWIKNHGAGNPKTSQPERRHFL